VNQQSRDVSNPDKRLVRELTIIDLGLCPYSKAHLYQLKSVEQRAAGTIKDSLILVEHPPVITMGKSGGSKNLLISCEEAAQQGIEVVEADRGGDITYHGPGQVVGYPIFHLDCADGDLLQLLRLYEESIIRVLACYGITGERIEGLTGVWVGREKIAAIGVAIKRSVSFHGFALNVNTSIENFGLIVPCGLEAMGVTSMHRILGYEIDQEAVKDNLVRAFRAVFGFSETG
jgi:lipoyl(octanoyl) transferase